MSCRATSVSGFLSCGFHQRNIFIHSHRYFLLVIHLQHVVLKRHTNRKEVVVDSFSLDMQVLTCLTCIYDTRTYRCILLNYFSFHYSTTPIFRKMIKFIQLLKNDLFRIVAWIPSSLSNNININKKWLSSLVERKSCFCIDLAHSLTQINHRDEFNKTWFL